MPKCRMSPGTSSTLCPSASMRSRPSSTWTTAGIAAVCSLSAWSLSKENSTARQVSAFMMVRETVAASLISIMEATPWT